VWQESKSKNLARSQQVKYDIVYIVMCYKYEIVLSVLPFTASDYSFGVFKLFLALLVALQMNLKYNGTVQLQTSSRFTLVMLIMKYSAVIVKCRTVIK